MIIRQFHTSSICRLKLKLKNKSHSSQQWLLRQLRDPYVEKAKQENYRCRSAFKLLEINEKFKIFAPGMTVIDCGAAPGSWTQVAVKLCNANQKTLNVPVGKVISIDRLPIHPIEGATIMGNMDFTLPNSQQQLQQIIDSQKVDLVISDMAPNATGISELDHDNIIMLGYYAMKFALQVICRDGAFLCKIWDGGQASQFENVIGKYFKSVKLVRPQATRDESSEKFILARNFRGLKENENGSEFKKG